MKFWELNLKGEKKNWKLVEWTKQVFFNVLFGVTRIRFIGLY